MTPVVIDDGGGAIAVSGVSAAGTGHPVRRGAARRTIHPLPGNGPSRG